MAPREFFLGFSRASASHFAAEPAALFATAPGILFTPDPLPRETALVALASALGELAAAFALGVLTCAVLWRWRRLLAKPASGVRQSVADHARALHALQEKDSRFELAIVGSEEGLWDWKVGTKEVYFSPRWKQMIGYEDHEIPNAYEEWEHRMHPDDLPQVLAHLKEYLEGRSTKYSVEFRMRHRDGDYRWIYSRGAALRGPDGKVIRLAGSHTDITERKREKLELERAKEAAEAANRAKSTFLAHMSHELRTPLGAIKGNAEMLADDPAIAARWHEPLQTILRNGEHLLAIINDLLDLARIEADRFDLSAAPCEPAALVQDALATVALQARQRGISLDTILATALPRQFQSDPIRIRQILVNLLSNAVKFSQGGAVRLRVALDTTTKPTRLAFTVEDDGPGLSADQLARVFEPFFRASATRSVVGTGLGLYIARKLAQALGGQLLACSTPGRGSAFTLQLPLGADDLASIGDCEPALPKEPAQPVVDGAGRLAGRVLVAEDSADTQALIRYFLQRAGLNASFVTDGRQAVDQVLAGDFDLVLMDMQMDEMDGYAATTELRQRGYDRPIIALTAQAMLGDREACLAAGCTDYLTKPIHRDALLTMLAQYLPTASSAAGRNAAAAPAPSTSLARLHALYRVHLPAELEQLRAALDNADWAAVAHLAHRLHGTAGSYGFHQISDTASLLESAVQERQEPDLCRDLLAELTALVAAASQKAGDAEV